MSAETQAAFAARIGMSRQYVSQLKDAGRLVMTDDGLVEVEASLARIESTRDLSKSGVADRHAAERREKADGRSDGQAGAGQMENAAGHYRVFQAVNMKAVAFRNAVMLRREAGQLVEMDRVMFVINDLGASVRAMLESAPDRWAPILVQVDDLARLRALMVEMSDELSRELSARVRRRLRELSDSVNEARDAPAERVHEAGDAGDG